MVVCAMYLCTGKTSFLVCLQKYCHICEFDMLLLTYFNYIPTMQFCECRFSYHIFVKFQKRKLTSSQASNSDFFSFFCFNKYRGQQVNSSKGYKWILLYQLISLAYFMSSSRKSRISLSLHQIQKVVFFEMRRSHHPSIKLKDFL